MNNRFLFTIFVKSSSMKKIISLMAIFALCAYCVCVNAQIKVVTNGKVAVGTVLTPLSTLSVGYQGDSTYLASFKTSGTKSGIYLRNTGPAALCIKNESVNNNYSMSGIDIQPYSTTASYAPRYGITSYGAYSSYISIGVAGSFKYNGYNPSYPALYAGIYGTVATINPYNDLYKGVYAGYFAGDARVLGSLYATVLTPSGTSNNMGAIYDTDDNEGGIGCVSERLNRVELLTFNRDVETRLLKEKAADEIRNNEYFKTNEDGRMAESDEDLSVPQTKLSSVRYGLAADQLKAVFPELVYEDEMGNVSINYIEMVPLLVQSINELQSRIDDLEQDNASLRAELTGEDMTIKSRDDATSISTTKEATDIISLSQNDPNPFSDRTTITVNIPEGVTTAAVFFYDMSGKQIDKRIITERGLSQLAITSSDMTEGMYLYSLIADGKVISTRKMILTK